MASGHVVFLDAAARAPIGCVSLGKNAHATFPAADMKLAIGANIAEKKLVRIEDALRLAQESDLDLVEVAPMARPPVCKLMDYGKFKYENAQKAREARRNQTNVIIKELKLRPKSPS